MSEGMMQFHLGVNAEKFIDGIKEAKATISELADAAFEIPGIGEAVGVAVKSISSLNAVAGGVFGAIDQGAALEHLSQRTGIGVASLYQLQAGFTAAGLSADKVSPMVAGVQQALTGVNAAGQNTGSVFARMGLSLEDLKKTDAAGQIMTIASALGKMDAGSAANIASTLFGDDATGDIMQLAGNLTDVSAAMGKAKTDADAFARSGDAFAHLNSSLDDIKHKTDTLFVGMAEGAVPAIQAIVDLLNQIDLTGLGQRIGHLFSGVTEAWKQGKITELMQLSFEAAVEFLVNFISNTLGSGDFWKGIGERMVGGLIVEAAALFKIFASIGTVLLAGIDTAFQEMFELIGKTPKLGKWFGLEGYQAGTFNENYASRRKEGEEGQQVVSDILGSGLKMSADGIKKQVNSVMEAAASAGGPAQENLKHFWDGLDTRTAGPASPAPAANTSTAGPTPPASRQTASPAPVQSQNSAREKDAYKPEHLSLEKMGFVMGGNSSLEYNRRTAVAVEQIAAFCNRTGAVTPTNSGNQTNLN